jgi:hypothetical protein
VPPPSSVVPTLGRAIDEVLLRALARSPEARFATAAELGEALEQAARREDLIATHGQVAAFVKGAAGDALATRRLLIRERHDSGDEAAAAKHDAVTAVVARADRTASLAVEPPAVASGTSLQPEATPRAEARGEPRRRGRIVWIVSAVTAASAAAAALAFVVPRGGQTATPVAAEPAASAVASSASTSADAPAATNAQPVVPHTTDVPAAPMPAPSATPAATAPPARTARSTRAIAPPAAKPVATATPLATDVHPTTTTDKADKAPPNPYAR